MARLFLFFWGNLVAAVPSVAKTAATGLGFAGDQPSPWRLGLAGTRATTAVEAAPKAFGAAMLKILQATSLRVASAWQARLPLLNVGRLTSIALRGSGLPRRSLGQAGESAYLFFRLPQNDDLAHANRDLFSPPFVDLTPKACAS